MTAEIAILNKHAIALAADSAVTAGDKIFQSANKIFALSKSKPVGIMIYSSAEYCGIPWESIIKEYRRKHSNVKFKKLSSYARHFLRFLSKDNEIISNKCSDKDIVTSITTSFVDDIQQNMIYIAKEMNENNNGKIDKKEFELRATYWFFNKFSEILSSNTLAIQKFVSFNDFVLNHSNIINDIYYKYKISKYEKLIPDLRLMFLESIYSLLTCDIFLYGYSGLVFTGFGDNEFFPRLCSYKIGYSLNNYVQFFEDHKTIIDNNNDASVIPFAQGDIISLFMDGIHPDMQDVIKDTFLSILFEYSKLLIDTLNISKIKRKLLSNKIDEMNRYIIDKLIKDIDLMKFLFWRPTISTISVMEPIEIANLAESLVSITSMHRRVAYPKETVGGPTDVALISKGDGFIWIKRKHYFDPKINPYFFKRNEVEACHERKQFKNYVT